MLQMPKSETYDFVLLFLSAIHTNDFKIGLEDNGSIIRVQVVHGGKETVWDKNLKLCDFEGYTYNIAVYLGKTGNVLLQASKMAANGNVGMS